MENVPISHPIKIFTIGGVIALMFFLPPRTVVNLYIVLGLSHFLLTYWYQMNAGKLSGLFFYIQIIIGLILFSLISFYYPDTFVSLGIFAFAALYFLIHLLLDERYLFNQPLSFLFFLNIMPTLFLYFGLVIDFAFQYQTIIFLRLGAFFVFILNSMLLLFHYKRAEGGTYYYMFLNIILFLLSFITTKVAFPFVFGGIVLYHYAIWYIFYFLRLKNNKEKRRAYLQRVFVVNVLFIFLYMLYTYFDAKIFNEVLGYFFVPTFFYLWTLLHVVFTTRVSDIKILIRSL